jgi:hypothetical protein
MGAMMAAAVEYRIEFGGAPQDVTITTFGPATPETLSGYIKDLVDDPRFRPGMFILANHQRMDASTVTAADVREQARMMNELDDRLGPCKVAIVVPSTLEFGFARMYQAHTAATQVDSQVFYSKADAVAWLESERQAGFASSN